MTSRSSETLLCIKPRLHHQLTLSAVGVAEAMLTNVFPAVITTLGLHLHEGPRVCDSPKCSTLSQSSNITIDLTSASRCSPARHRRRQNWRENAGARWT